MSRQLHISSLFSAFALVVLCMGVAVSDRRGSDAGHDQEMAQAEVSSGLRGWVSAITD